MTKHDFSLGTTDHGHSRLYAGLFLLLLVLLALGFFFFYTQDYGRVNRLGDKGGAYSGIHIRHRHDTRRVRLDERIAEPLRNFISWHKDVVMVEIVVNDIPADNNVTPESPPLVFNLDVHFSSGAVIRTRPRQLPGSQLKDQIAQDIKRAEEQHARYLQDGTIRPGQKGRVYNL
ncbi:MAG: hypothetical protein H0S85_15020 [Desulfovibrionaceae bacterium]|jgi:hypothetical protein|nr:hypothetical protein [Desulfovibrionaceae bacterium]